MPTNVVSLAVPEPSAAFIAQLVVPAAVLWCIGHHIAAPAPCPQVHSAACGSAARFHIATGTSATVPTWQNNQIAVSGASTRRSSAMGSTLSLRR
ncbi:MAG: hypothetical protein ABI818_03365 [Acidobacteriota bacterium]